MDESCNSTAPVVESTASARGQCWAERVVRQLRGSPSTWPAWPAFDASAKVRAIALRHGRDLSGDEAAHLVWARACSDSAAKRYEQLRAERLAPPPTWSDDNDCEFPL